MKHLIFLFALALTAASCNKATDENTLVGRWEIDSYEEGGSDQTTLFKSTYLNYKVLYDGSNNYIETYTIAGVNTTNAGSWKLTNGGADFELTSQVDNSKRYYHIVVINPSSATITEDSGNKSYNLRRI